MAPNPPPAEKKNTGCIIASIIIGAIVLIFGIWAFWYLLIKEESNVGELGQTSTGTTQTNNDSDSEDSNTGNNGNNNNTPTRPTPTRPNRPIIRPPVPTRTTGPAWEYKSNGLWKEFPAGCQKALSGTCRLEKPKQLSFRYGTDIKGKNDIVEVTLHEKRLGGGKRKVYGEVKIGSSYHDMRFREKQQRVEIRQECVSK